MSEDGLSKYGFSKDGLSKDGLSKDGLNKDWLSKDGLNNLSKKLQAMTSSSAQLIKWKRSNKNSHSWKNQNILVFYCLVPGIWTIYWNRTKSGLSLFRLFSSRLLMVSWNLLKNVVGGRLPFS